MLSWTDWVQPFSQRRQWDSEHFDSLQVTATRHEGSGGTEDL
jgi:hypothetical protein